MWCRRQVAQSFVPIELLSCTRLRHLSFIGCQGLFLPPVVGELISMQSLRVNRTDLADTRDAIHPCTFQRGSFATFSLTLLDLSACNLDVLPFQASPAFEILCDCNTILVLGQALRLTWCPDSICQLFGPYRVLSAPRGAVPLLSMWAIGMLQSSRICTALPANCVAVYSSPSGLQKGRRGYGCQASPSIAWCSGAADVVSGEADPLLSSKVLQGCTIASHVSQQSVVGVQMCHLEKLERLVLAHNALADMPRLLAAFLRRLRSIDLSFNRFKRIPPVLAALTCLQHVNLSGNPDLEARPWPIPVTPTPRQPQPSADDLQQ